MKKLLSFVFLLALLGCAGFLYRAVLESPTHNTNTPGTSTAAACPMDAKICPDGTSIGRTGPSCEFAACALPNVELPQAHLSFALPATFKPATGSTANDLSILGAYEKTGFGSGTSTQPDSIVVRRYTIPAGKDANSVMLAHTMHESSGEMAKSMEEFSPVIINGKTYQMIAVERFEAIVHIEYYLPRDTDVLRFEVIQHDVTQWTDPSFKVRDLSSVRALEALLGTVQTS